MQISQLEQFLVGSPLSVCRQLNLLALSVFWRQIGKFRKWKIEIGFIVMPGIQVKSLPPVRLSK